MVNMMRLAKINAIHLFIANFFKWRQIVSIIYRLRNIFLKNQEPFAKNSALLAYASQGQ
jgi:cytochrome c oxidase assembly factor CtaG